MQAKPQKSTKKPTFGHLENKRAGTLARIPAILFF